MSGPEKPENHSSLPSQNAGVKSNLDRSDATVFFSGDPMDTNKGTNTGIPAKINFLPEGTILGKYSIMKPLGQGGMGVVYLGFDIDLQREVALKVLPSELTNNATLVDRFLLEARSAAKLSHPNTVAVYDVGQQEGHFYIAMELVTGGSTEDRLLTNGPYSVQEATQIIADACKGLAAAHELGLVHRDIKPANLMHSAGGTIKVADFGLARGDALTGQRLTQTNTVVGTPYFMSPEQCQTSNVDRRSDIYSLGATYYNLLTGVSPYEDADSAMQIMFAHCNAEIPDPRKIKPMVPEACSAIIRKAMAKKVADRYQNAEEMLTDLNAVLASLSGSGIQLPSQSGIQPATQAKNGLTRHLKPSTILAFLGIGALLLWGIVYLATFMPGEDDKDKNSPIVPSSENPIRIGVLHSMTGTMASSEKPVVDAVNLAVEEINKSGGLLGRKVEPILADGESDPDDFAREAKRLIEEEKVCTIFGCWTSASRKAVLPIVQENNHLLVYPVQYEGIEMSPNIVYLGASPNQQILPAVDWLCTKVKKKRYFIVGSDYIYPRVAGEIIKDHLKKCGVELAGEAYLPLGSPDVKSIIDQIVKSKPDVILNNINGDSNVPFFRDLRKAGIQPESVPTMSFSIGEVEIRNLKVQQMVGDYAAWTYFQSLDNPVNKDFVDRFHAKYGNYRSITDPMESAYVGVKIWAQAVREVGSTEPSKIRQAMRNQRINAPEGEVRIDPDTQHSFKTPRIGQIQANGQFKVIWSADQTIAPLPYPPTRTSDQWRSYLFDLYFQWGNRWSRPNE